MDITERYQIESLLRQGQKMEAIGTLAGGIAHDFNNILGAIMGYTEMALTNPKLDDRLRRYLNQVYTAGERARDLVKQILAFSRQSDQKPRPLRVSPIVQEVLKLLRASLPTTITIRQDIQSDMDTVLADPTQLHQILMNLCTNAAHAMRETKGELKVSLVPVEIKPRDALIIHHGLTPDMYLKLTVSDTGAGIAPDIMDRIFDPFFTTKKPAEGTGMGLSVVYGIIKGYNGAITVETELDKGTEIHVYLPLLMETKSEQEIDKTVFIVGGKERVLFVDDEENLVLLGKDMLTGLGYEVAGRTSSVEALEVFRVKPRYFDLVITDMTMPNMTGVDLAKDILMIRPDIPIILCTGFSDMISEEKAKNIGIRKFIMKPLLKNSLAMTIREVLDTR
jgi:nitrogen-specific signal transduction histidine kinase/ActR/RegA family two-component response regulator